MRYIVTEVTMAIDYYGCSGVTTKTMEDDIHKIP
jgi:hypothetical protein